MEMKTTWNVLYSSLGMSTFALDINNLDFSGPYTDKLLLSKTWEGGVVCETHLQAAQGPAEC